MLHFPDSSDAKVFSVGVTGNDTREEGRGTDGSLETNAHFAETPPELSTQSTSESELSAAPKLAGL